MACWLILKSLKREANAQGHAASLTLLFFLKLLFSLSSCNLRDRLQDGRYSLDIISANILLKPLLNRFLPTYEKILFLCPQRVKIP